MTHPEALHSPSATGLVAALGGIQADDAQYALPQALPHCNVWHEAESSAHPEWQAALPCTLQRHITPLQGRCAKSAFPAIIYLFFFTAY